MRFPLHPADAGLSSTEINGARRRGTASVAAFGVNTAYHSPIVRDAASPIDTVTPNATQAEPDYPPAGARACRPTPSRATENVDNEELVNANILYSRNVDLEVKLAEARLKLLDQEAVSLGSAIQIDIMAEDREAARVLTAALSKIVEKIAVDAHGPGVNLVDIDVLRLLLFELERSTRETRA